MRDKLLNLLDHWRVLAEFKGEVIKGLSEKPLAKQRVERELEVLEECIDDLGGLIGVEVKKKQGELDL